MQKLINPLLLGVLLGQGFSAKAQTTSETQAVKQVVVTYCGYDSFQLVKLADGWKIAHIIDTRRKEKCK